MKLKIKYCTFCGEDAVDIKNEDKGTLLACTSCGRVISYQEIEKAAIETFKAMSSHDLPVINKEPEKVRVPLFLDRHVTYLHADGKTWERAPNGKESASHGRSRRTTHKVMGFR